MKKQEWQLNRVSDSCCEVKNDLGLDVKLFANQDVSIDNVAFEELFDFLDVERADCLESACHGAGRVMSRGQASHVPDKVYDQQTQQLRIVTAVDLNSPQMQMRRDIMAKYKERIKEEAPYAYKPITPVIESVKEAGIANPVAKLMPLCTVKG